MLGHLFRRQREKNNNITANLYAGIVAAARQPEFYSEWGAPDTPLGRFELIALHMVLVLRRISKRNEALAGIAQEVTDHFFLEVDHSLRELGVGDVGVPKRMKRLAKMFYGRAESYTSALDGNDEAALAEALERNIWPQSSAKAGAAIPLRHDAAALARYAFQTARKLNDQSDEAFERGDVVFLRPEV